MIDVTSVRIDFDANLEVACSVLCDSMLRVEIELQSRFPGPVRCDEVYVTVQPVKTSTENDAKGAKLVPKTSVELPVGSMMKEGGLNKDCLSHSTMLQIKAQQHLKQDGSLSSVSLVCPNVHQLLG